MCICSLEHYRSNSVFRNHNHSLCVIIHFSLCSQIIRRTTCSIDIAVSRAKTPSFWVSYKLENLYFAVQRNNSLAVIKGNICSTTIIRILRCTHGFFSLIIHDNHLVANNQVGYICNQGIRITRRTFHRNCVRLCPPRICGVSCKSSRNGCRAHAINGDFASWTTNRCNRSIVTLIKKRYTLRGNTEVRLIEIASHFYFIRIFAIENYNWFGGSHRSIGNHYFGDANQRFRTNRKRFCISFPYTIIARIRISPGRNFWLVETIRTIIIIALSCTCENDLGNITDFRWNSCCWTSIGTVIIRST